MMNSSHEDFKGRSAAVLAVTVVMIVLSSLFVFFRTLSRAAIVKKLSVDDYFMIVAWVTAFGLSFCVLYGCTYGLGRHETDIPRSWQDSLRKVDYAFSVLYQPALMATKTSILAFYLTLPASNRIFKWACIGTLAVVNIGGLALGLFMIFQCRPVSAAWRFPLPSGAHCTDIVTIYLSSAPLNIITDLAIFFLPMPILTGMRLPKKQKIILVITFSFGIFVAAVDVVRIVYLQGAAKTRIEDIYRATKHGLAQDSEENDFSYYASLVFVWSVIEVNIGIMCACVPGLKPLISRFLPSLIRGSGDPPSRKSSKAESLSMPEELEEMKEAHRVPDMPEIPEDTHRQDFGSTSHPPDDDDDGPMGMMDFLTTPDMNEFPRAERTDTALTNTSRHTKPDAPNMFDFVNMKGKKSMVYMTVRESFFPIAMVTVLFFIWGFEYGLLDVLNQQFQRVAHMSAMQSSSIHSAYFAGYFFGPVFIGQPVLRFWGFKACYTVGLSIYACGLLIFWPAAVLTSFVAFVISNFIVAFGLSILEVSANPFIFLCGPQQYGEIRLNLSQGMQAIGSVVAPLIADRAFFHKTLNAPSLIDTQWAYLGIALFTILLAVAYFYLPLPEATNEELEDVNERLDGANKAKMGNISIIWITLAFGVLSQFFYVGGQEVNGTTFNSYLAVVAPTFKTSNYMAIAHTAFAVSRFTAAGLGFWIKPRYLLLFFYLGAIVFGVLAMNFKGGTGVAMITMVFFFEGPLFSLIFAQALRGMGRHTKFASVCITAAVSGGSVFSPIANHIALTNKGAMYSLVVGVAAFAAGTVFPIGLNLSPLARKQCDPIKDVTSPPDSRPESTSSRASRALHFLHPGKKRSRESTRVEFREQKDGL